MGKQTSWEKDSSWYSAKTSGRGNYFHEHVVIPNTLRLLGLSPIDSLLDLACGSGVLGRAVAKDISYTGIDISPTLVSSAKHQDRSAKHTYIVGDITETLPVRDRIFTKAAIILALQNVKESAKVIKNASLKLTEGGIFVIVLNHPAFRIPRQSSWGTDEQNKLQYRRVNRYLSPLEIPITMHPGTTDSSVTWSYHLPLGAYTAMLADNGFMIRELEEWTSDKVSEGKFGKMENRARSEFPLFLTISAVKTRFS